MSLLQLFKQVTTFVFDVDGVLTDGTLIVLPGGLMARKMNVKDGYALQLAVKRGYDVAVISGGASEEVAERLAKLGIKEVFMRVIDKVSVLESYLSTKNISWQQTLYMGDDIADLEVMKKAGVACCPADAVVEIKEVSAYISNLNGGYGCAREAIEKVLKLRGDWKEDTHIPSR
jgi:3-deoxy-D-manno-octulosonate 8-phosphate phosphatase (KDO 8-P phosphatase)